MDTYSCGCITGVTEYKCPNCGILFNFYKDQYNKIPNKKGLLVREPNTFHKCYLHSRRALEYHLKECHKDVFLKIE